MREIRLSGSEGGVALTTPLLPLSSPDRGVTQSYTGSPSVPAHKLKSPLFDFLRVLSYYANRPCKWNPWKPIAVCVTDCEF